MGLFEERFYYFIDHDLREIAVESAKLELKRIISQLQSFIHSAAVRSRDKSEESGVQLEAEKEQMIELYSEAAIVNFYR